MLLEAKTSYIFLNDALFWQKNIPYAPATTTMLTSPNLGCFMWLLFWTGVFYVASLLNWRKKYQYALIFHVIFPAHSFCIFPALFSAREPFLPLIAALPSAEERLWEAFSETCLNFYQFPQCSVKNCQEINVYQSIQQKRPRKGWFFIQNPTNGSEINNDK